MTPPERHELARRLGTGDAVTIGLAAMLGAGVFAAVGPAAGSAGAWLLAGLLIAGVVSFCNATSSAQLAARYPESGGTYVYARERLGNYWGFLAGWGFVIGKSASLSAMALTLGEYAYPPLARPIAILAVVALTAVNHRGVEKTARLARILVILVLVALAVVVGASLGGGQASINNLSSEMPEGVLGVLRSAGLLFFAFAGYARIATLGEEAREPERTIPKAIPIALGIVVVVYAAVMTTALLAVGPVELARSRAPLAAAVEAGRLSALAPVVRVGATLAAAGVLLSLLAGVSRTILSMARRYEMPSVLDAVHPRYRTPHYAGLAIGVVLVGIVSFADLRAVIGFSSFTVLTYYALANASAWTLDSRLRGVAGAGFVGCVLLAFTLPAEAVIRGMVLLALGSIAWFLTRGHRPRDQVVRTAG